MDYDREIGTLRANVDELMRVTGLLRDEMKSGFARLEEMFGGRLNKHSDRLGSLERWRSWVNGGLALLGFLWAVIVAWALKK